MRTLLMILLFGLGFTAPTFATDLASPIGCDEQLAVQAAISYNNVESSIPATESFKYCTTQYSGMALATITFALAIIKERDANPGNLALRRLQSKAISDATRYQGLSLLFRKKWPVLWKIRRE